MFHIKRFHNILYFSREKDFHLWKLNQKQKHIFLYYFINNNDFKSYLTRFYHNILKDNLEKKIHETIILKSP